MPEDVRSSEDLYKRTYLGDAVYASFDRYQIWLHVQGVGDIALNPDTYASLRQYAKRFYGDQA